MSESYIVKENTIAARGLPTILREHIDTADALYELGSVVEMEVIYPGAFFNALNTLAWFVYGVKNKKLKNC